jgi:uncharacterized sulfatase
MHGMKTAGCCTLVLSSILSLVAPPPLKAAEARPNVLWITCEDTSPHLGCYGDMLAATPHLDALAREAVRFTQAFAYTGVCAPSRSCLITGVYPMRLGSHHMRSSTWLPEKVKCFPQYLRAAGYYCTNNVKQDYNFAAPPETWDESSNQAHWRKRKPGQPFFSVFNFTVCHQSQIFATQERYLQNTRRLTPQQRHDPAAIRVPPIHPDIPEFRQEWARHYDNVTAMDYQVGDLLQQLQQDGLAEDTIVFFFSDHGTGMPSIKNYAWDVSLRVPLLIRFPTKWQHLAPGRAGETTDRLVSFVDFAPTMLSLCGVEIPAYMQGAAFLGGQGGQPRRYVYGGADRHGERLDTTRYVHDGRLHYLRNFQRHLPAWQFISYVDQHASMRAWQQMHEEGRLSGAAARFFASPRPAEELYDVQADPWETRNLAGDPQYRDDLERLRAECSDWMQRTGDLGLLPEREVFARAKESTPYDIAMDPQKNPLPDLLAAAQSANALGPQRIPHLTRLLANPDSAIRWWGALGLVALGPQAAPAESELRRALEDSSPDVRIACAEALANLGHDQAALPVLIEALRHESPFVRLAALNVLDRMGPRAAPAIPAIEKAAGGDRAHPHVAEYVGRMVGYLPGRIGGK